MIDIYTDKKESKDWILQNDLYFNLNTGNEEMSQNEINLIQQVDEARVNTQLRKQASSHKNAPIHMDLFHFDFEAMTCLLYTSRCV